ncbi:MAG: ferritin family protein [Patescibacteria group bacterium]
MDDSTAVFSAAALSPSGVLLRGTRFPSFDIDCDGLGGVSGHTLLGLSGLAKEAASGLSLRQKLHIAGLKTRKPTQAQAEAGNYRKGHIHCHGLRITIEVPKNGTREGTDSNGKHWKVVMPHPYGYVRGTEAADGDHLDCFVGPHPHSELVYVIDQTKPGTDRFDEHKVVFGALNMTQARDIYLAAYESGWKGLGAITPMTIHQFKTWLQSGDLMRPISKQTIMLKAAEVSNPDVDTRLPAIVISRHASYQILLPERPAGWQEREKHGTSLLQMLGTKASSELPEVPAPHAAVAVDGEPTASVILRQAITAELDAVNLYEQMAASTGIKSLQELLLRIAKEEKVHVGEFTALLEKIDKEHTESVEEGKAEARKDGI